MAPEGVNVRGPVSVPGPRLDSAGGVATKTGAMLKDNPVMKKLVETGEEQVGRLAQQLLANERFVSALQALVSKTLMAKGTLDKSLRSALSAANLPSTSDVEALKGKVDDLERMLASIEAKVDALGRK